MTHILGIPGSLREGSFNRALLLAAADLAPAGCRLEVASLQGIPLYNADVEKSEGLPAPVRSLQERIAASDGLILATPEYNNSIPGVFKNALDWLTRPPAEVPRLFGERPVALCGASPGPGGTRLAQLAWLPILRTLGLQPWFGKTLALGEAHKAFDTEGKPRDEKVREQIRNFITGFVRYLEPGKP
jgi:NAD(P)H-dependent FMN reductase